MIHTSNFKRIKDILNITDICYLKKIDIGPMDMGENYLRIKKVSCRQSYA